ncbi:unnamed protein product [Notodromas monacha]|uniref:Uncharacterized protein n=1 Tax=Notodromas monacha TaxID=399045 RepID=A0A7R9BFH1_9CRUS|nr:unnamed protein product [Notodromas monacha]CAG0913226.1 unnamed protein product [Notodromas monacha]
MEREENFSGNAFRTAFILDFEDKYSTCLAHFGDIKLNFGVAACVIEHSDARDFQNRQQRRIAKAAINGLIFFPHRSSQGKHERSLLNHLLLNYNVLERPVANESDPLVLSFGLTLMQIIDVDEKNQILTTNIWLNLEWNDYNLRWDPAQFGGVKDLRIPPKNIWKPDVLMYNSADEGFDGTYKTNVVVRHNGSCLYVPPGIFKSTCKIDITWFPFDDQKCEMKFGSWTYDGFQLDLTLQSDEGGDLSSFINNGEWDLIGVPGKRNSITYACCPAPYVDITFVVHIRRRTLYYFSNLIVPCVLISSMALLGFTLPPDSGEKLTLGVTILLSLTVFLNMVAEKMPSTSDAIPLIGTYFNCIMFMVASSVVLTVLVLNYHHRNPETHDMAPWVKTIFLQWLPWVLRMQRPGKKITRKTIMLNNKMRNLELKERSSRSLLANVLDIDDDIRGTMGMGMAMGMHSQAGNSASYLRITGNSMDDSATMHNCLTAQRELQMILKVTIAETFHVSTTPKIHPNPFIFHHSNNCGNVEAMRVKEEENNF